LRIALRYSLYHASFVHLAGSIINNLVANSAIPVTHVNGVVAFGYISPTTAD
jgi:hypothetical protein